MKTFRQYIAEELGRTVTFGELPEDLQVLIAQFFDIRQQTKELAKLEQGEPMTVEEWDVDKFPEVNVAAVEDPGDERDERYALDIPHNEHPILVNGKEWLDGRHRVWAARQRGQKKIKVIDLKKYGLGPVGALGPIREGLVREADSSTYYSHWGWLEPNGKTKDLADDDGVPLSHMQAVRQIYKITYEQAFKQGYIRWYVTRDGKEFGIEVIAIPAVLERAMKFLMRSTYFTEKISIEIWMPSLRKAWKRQTFDGSTSKNEGDAHRLLDQARSAAVDGTLDQDI